MTEYYFWEDNKIARANGVVEIRKKFIQKWGKNKVANIFKKGYGTAVGHIYYGLGGWVYRDYIKHKAYAIREDGRIEYELPYIPA